MKHKQKAADKKPTAKNIPEQRKLFFLESYDNQSESNHDKSAENIEIGHNLINVIVHNYFFP